MIIMKQFVYTIRDPLGIHARPAGMLARAAGAYKDTIITVEKTGNMARATQIIKMMGMGIKQGDVVTITAEGPGEDKAIETMREFFQTSL